MKRWIASEDDIVRATYPDYQTMSAKLPGRTRDACRGRAQVLGIKAKIHPWTAAQIAKLRAMWPSDRRALELAFPGRTYLQIAARARLLELRRIHYRRPRGVAFWDSVQAEGGRRHLGNSALDRLAGTGTAISSGKGGHQHYIAAAEALGGIVTIIWED